MPPSFDSSFAHNLHFTFDMLTIRERPIRVKRLMSDVPIFRQKNSDVRVRCLVVYHPTLSRHQSHHITDDAGHQQTWSVN